MKISVLETNMLSAADISLSELSSLGDVKFFETLTPDEVVLNCLDSEIILCSKTIFHKELIDRLPNLRFIGVFATGYNNIDVKYARQRGITVSNTPAYSTPSVVQHVFSLLLCLAGNTHNYINSTHRGDWINSPTFSYFNMPITEIQGKTLGIVGYGATGKGVADIGAAFGMNILVCTRTKKNDCPHPQMTIDEMLPLCDFVSLNCPLNEGTSGLINKERLSKMKKSAFIINAARGPVVVEKDIAEALKNGTISGFAADVITHEPMREDSPLKDAPNCILTPHIAWASIEARTRLVDICVNNIKGYINGKPVNVVN